MGALSGHIMNLYEDFSLTFKQLTEILEDLTFGRITVYEKFDGYAIHARWDEFHNDVRFARNLTDIKNGGVTMEEMAARYQQYDSFSKSLLESGYVLQKTFANSSRSTKSSMSWLPFEIVTNPGNCLEYDGKFIIAHKYPVLNYAGKHVKESHSIPFGMYGEWSVHQPVPAKLRVLKDKQLTFRESIEKLCTQNALKTDATLQEWVLLESEKWYMKCTGNPGLSKAMASRAVKSTPDLRQIKKQWIHLGTTIESLKSKERMFKEVLEPLESIVLEYGKERLDGLKSKFIKDSYYESQRLKNNLLDASKNLNETEKREYDKHISKINLENYNCSIEGLVFQVNEKTYKLTGVFAPTNRILGMVKYRK